MIAKNFPVYKCGHKKAIGASDCIRAMVGDNNSQHFVVATQDFTLRTAVRAVPGTPVLYLHGNSPTLEKPSELTKGKVEEEGDNRGLTPHQAKAINVMKKQVFGEPEPVKLKKKKRKGPKGPNPLSCKKKKKKKSGDPLHGVKDKLVKTNTGS